jgi:aldehyde:ferredoxin oxidoreductase
VQIHSAKGIWGLDTQAAQAAMGKGGTLAIGPAGENRVKFATVVSQERSHGRTGMGAVMGSKNLKGIIARGKCKIPIRDKARLKKRSANGRKCFRSTRPPAKRRRAMALPFS